MTKIVDSDKELDKLCETLRACKSVGVDLEGDGMYHFREKICLLQFSDGRDSWIVDPLKAKQISKLAPFFSDPSTEKIFHGCDYDIKSLYRDYKIIANNVFDTEIAARFTGVTYSGLDHLLLDFFGVKTEKKYQKKDWSKRPLKEEMLEYAEKDAFYLVQISKILKERLIKLKRLDWACEESLILSKSRVLKNENTHLFESFKGAGRLDRRSLAILEELLKFRYNIAEKTDRPLYKIIPNKLIIDVAEKKDGSKKALKSVMSKGYYKRYASRISDIVNKALKIPESKLPVFWVKKHKNKLNNNGTLISKKLRKWRLSKSDELCLDTGLVANNALIDEIARTRPASMEELSELTNIKNWQKKEFGGEILEILKSMNSDCKN